MFTVAEKRGAVIALMASLLVVAFAWGRHSAPEHVVTQVKTQTVTVTKDIVKTQVVHDVHVVHDVQTKTNTVVQVKWVTAPDGTKTVTETATDQLLVNSTNNAKEQTTVAQQKTSEAQRTVATEKTIAVNRALPRWSLALMPGASLGAPLVTIPGPVPHMVIGASLERRVFGPVFGGVWLSTSGAAGLTLRGEL